MNRSSLRSLPVTATALAVCLSARGARAQGPDAATALQPQVEAPAQPTPTPQPAAPQPPAAASDASPARELAPFGVRLVAEGGFLGVLSNFGAFGTNPTRIDFKDAAAQDVLQPYTRWSAELDLGRRHTLVFLFQPLSTEGTRTPPTDERYEDVTFRGGVPVRTTFSFPFYRLSYLYEVAQGERGYLALGGTAQIRNAEYRYEQLDGTRFSRSSSVGFVPALKARGELSMTRGAFLGLEIDGIYAPISVLNGSDNETVGAILDASVRAGLQVHERADVFLNLRYLGGGATNEDPNEYAKNWLHALFVGLGARLDLVGAPTRVHGPPRVRAR